MVVKVSLECQKAKIRKWYAAPTNTLSNVVLVACVIFMHRFSKNKMAAPFVNGGSKGDTETQSRH